MDIEYKIVPLPKEKWKGTPIHMAVESDEFYIEVRNESQYIEYDVLEKFFDVGYSKKGENRGLGLYNVKQICEEFKLDIMLQNIEIEGVNWLSFKIWK